MSAFIAANIEKVCTEEGLAAAKARYKAYFINTSLYTRYKADTDTILITDGFGDCIVTA